MSRSAGCAPVAQSPAVIEAVRLFNARSYYESHDVFEEEWADARGPRREALKALVKLAAGMYHLQTSGFQGAENLLSSGLTALDALPPEEIFVEIDPLRDPIRRCLVKIGRLNAGQDIEWEPEDLPRLRLLSRQTSRAPAPRDGDASVNRGG